MAAAPPDAQIISRATASNVPAYPKKLPTIIITTLAALVLSSGLVLTRELLDAPVAGAGGGAAGAPSRTIGRTRGKSRGSLFGRLFGRRQVASDPAVAAAAAAAQIGHLEGEPDSMAARLASIVKRPPPLGVPASAIETFAHNIHQEGLEGSQIVFFGVTPQLETSRIAIKFARALAKEARTILVGLGSGDAALREISGDPGAAGLAELAAGEASIGQIITKDKTSGLNLILSGRARADRRGLMSAPGMARNFEALGRSYGHVVIDAGPLDTAEPSAISRIAPHAMLVAEKLTAPATAKAREQLLDVGFDDVTVLVAERPEAAASAAPPVSAAA